MPKHNRHSLVSCKWIVASLAGGTSGEGSGSALYVASPMGNQSVRVDGRRTTFSVQRLMCAMVASVLLLGLGLAQIASAQTGTDPLQLYKNYFVTGDYVVGGVGLRGTGVNGWATGTINIPDSNAYAAGTLATDEQVPTGADVLAAYLYWQTVESSQGVHAGQVGSFNGYSITGTSLDNTTPVSWSSGGCSGSAMGTKTIRTYRADVRPYLPLDSTGRINANGSYTVVLADSGTGGGTPLTLGATLVIIYRLLDSGLPLSAVVIYDGAYSPSATSQITSQSVVGFYQASEGPTAKTTLIAGNGQSNKWESVSIANQNTTVNLPSLYTGLPPLPGKYGSWDNPTWVTTNYGSVVSHNDSSETTSVVPAATNGGCVTLGAIVFSTTVQSSDGDGLVDVWKTTPPGQTTPGYFDANTGAFVALPGAQQGHKDLFVEIDYASNLDGSDGTGSYLHSHLPKKAALDMAGDAFLRAGVYVHFDVGNVYQTVPPDRYIIPYSLTGAQGGNSISEGLLKCTDSPSARCPFPGVPVVGWKGGLLYIKDNHYVPGTTNPLGNFQYGRKDSYHYVLFGHALGQPRTLWGAVGATPSLASNTIATLVSISVTNNVGTVTLQTPAPLEDPTELIKPGDTMCTDANCDRVTIGGALNPLNQALNATYLVLSPSSTLNSNNTWTTTFTIQTAGVANGTYNYSNEPQLVLSYGGPLSSSGESDIGGADSAVTFGLWPADDASGCQKDPSVALYSGQVYCTNQVGTITAEAGTLMHELGHTFGLMHGGTYYQNNFANQSRAEQINDMSGPPTYDWNCKPDYLSVMNYLFQVRGFPDGGIDYSGQTLPSLSESALSELNGIGSDRFGGASAPHFTRWFGPPNAFDQALQASTGKRYMTVHCDGTLITDGAQMVRVDGNSYSTNIDWNNDLTIPDFVAPQDVNFNGIVGDTSPLTSGLGGFNDAKNLDLRQISTAAGVFGFSRGGGYLGGFGGGYIGGFGEQDSDTANSTADAPTGLNAAMSGHNVLLNWTAPGFGQPRTYYVWRALGTQTVASTSAFTMIATLRASGGADAPPPTSYLDTHVQNNHTYTYFVLQQNKQGAESGPSNLVPFAVHY
jgi:hypothetical protein